MVPSHQTLFLKDLVKLMIMIGREKGIVKGLDSKKGIMKREGTKGMTIEGMIELMLGERTESKNDLKLRVLRIRFLLEVLIISLVKRNSNSILPSLVKLRMPRLLEIQIQGLVGALVSSRISMMLLPSG
jgi:hypothetical protein